MRQRPSRTEKDDRCVDIRHGELVTRGSESAREASYRRRSWNRRRRKGRSIRSVLASQSDPGRAPYWLCSAIGGEKDLRERRVLTGIGKDGPLKSGAVAIAWTQSDHGKGCSDRDDARGAYEQSRCRVSIRVRLVFRGSELKLRKANSHWRIPSRLRNVSGKTEKSSGEVVARFWRRQITTPR